MATISVNIAVGKEVIVGTERNKKKLTSADNPVSLPAHEARKLIKRGIVAAA